MVGLLKHGYFRAFFFLHANPGALETENQKEAVQSRGRATHFEKQGLGLKPACLTKPFARAFEIKYWSPMANAQMPSGVPGGKECKTKAYFFGWLSLKVYFCQKRVENAKQCTFFWLVEFNSQKQLKPARISNAHCFTEEGGGLSSRGFTRKRRALAPERPRSQLLGFGHPYPLKLQALGKLIFYRHIAHVTQKVEKLCF